MQMTPDRHAESLPDAVAAYVRALPIPALDQRAVFARRGRTAAPAPRRRLLRTAALATAAALVVALAADGSAVVAAMQRAFAAFTVVGGHTIPMSVREVDLAHARADLPFEIIAPPSLPGSTMTLREIRSSASPAGDSVAFDLDMGPPGPPVTIVERRDGGGPSQFYLTLPEPGRGDAGVAPVPAQPPAGGQIVVAGKLGDRSFVPLTWVTRGTRIVLMAPPGRLSDAQIDAIRAAMSN